MKKQPHSILTFFKYTFLSIIFVSLSFFLLFHFGFLSNFTTIKFDRSKLSYVNTQVKIFDNDNKEILINNEQVKDIQLNEVPSHLKNAFISIEDKQFYRHKGLNYKRILKAMLKNISSLKLKEGASTISQQLIKNTHLTNEKTFKRKINEMLLTQKLEKTLNKDQILTSYLNAIYFGSGSFGINQASQRYFSKDPKDLSLAESATLAGIIKSPNTYSPISNPEKCLQRRNIVLKEMLRDKKINQDEFDEAYKTNLNLNINRNFLGNNTYYNACIDEACKILKLNEKDLLLKEYQIYTYKNNELQTIVKKEILNSKAYTENINCDSCVLSIDNKTGGINAFYGKSDYDLLTLKRQPGSTFKPIISYAPAIEYNLLNPLTPILDEQLTIDGYTPKNYNNKYLGWTNAKDSLAKSLNIPSVKILNYTGIDRSKQFAENLNITFNPNDNGYSLALGGLTEGITIKQITNCYQSFANNGKFIPATFIKEIKTKSGKTIYSHTPIEKQVMKDSTAFLITDMLKESVKSGTCKKLKLKDYNLASKTGTVANINSKNKENTDVWNISYNPKNTLCVWFGSTKKDNLLPKNITGGNSPTLLAQNIYKQSNLKSTDFSIPLSVEEKEINSIDYFENKKVLLANENTPERYKIKGYFNKFNLPKEESTVFDKINKFEIQAKVNDNNEVEITFNPNKHLYYELYKQDDDYIEKIAEIRNKDTETTIYDKNIKIDNIYTYFIKAFYNTPINDFQQKENQISNYVKIFVAQKNPPL